MATRGNTTRRNTTSTLPGSPGAPTMLPGMAGKPYGATGGIAGGGATPAPTAPPVPGATGTASAGGISITMPPMNGDWFKNAWTPGLASQQSGFGGIGGGATRVDRSGGMSGAQAQAESALRDSFAARNRDAQQRIEQSSYAGGLGMQDYRKSQAAMENNMGLGQGLAGIANTFEQSRLKEGDQAIANQANQLQAQQMGQQNQQFIDEMNYKNRMGGAQLGLQQALALFGGGIDLAKLSVDQKNQFQNMLMGLLSGGSGFASGGFNTL